MWRDDAIVLFDWLTNTDLNTVPIAHPAQKQALADLHTRLEEVLGPEDEEASEVARAQAAVAQDMGW